MERGPSRGILTLMTATATPRQRRGRRWPQPGVERSIAAAAERRLVLLLCATEDRRRRDANHAADLLARADPERLVELLGGLRLTGLAGARLRSLGLAAGPRLEEAIQRWTAQAREQGRTHELTTLAILRQLEHEGIRALAVKGSVLARELYGDVGVRSPGDIDILVAPEQLAAAVESVQRLGWTHQAVAARATALPVLHETLIHSSLPRVELHWRVHWYETRFAVEALDRAQRCGIHEPLIMQPADGLAALMLFYARDGFAGLRMPADAAAWWDARCGGLDMDQLVGEMALRYPRLAVPLRLGAELLGALVGLPSRLRARSFRLRVAAQLATPFDEVTLAEVRTKVGLVDLLLAPPRGARASLRRERQKIPRGLERPLNRHDDLLAHLARGEHLLRTIRRWALALVPAAVRACRSRCGAGEDLAQRVVA